MNLYLVVCGDKYEYDTIGVYSSQEKAEAALKLLDTDFYTAEIKELKLDDNEGLSGYLEKGSKPCEP